MPVHDDLGMRMKLFYEQISKSKLMRRCPVIIRIDGRAFHTFTRGFEKPFDSILMKTMQDVMKYLCENVQGCVLGYTQSDEISLVLIDYQRNESSAWFDYEIQKVCSIAASMATKGFIKTFTKNVYEACRNVITDTEFIQAMLYGNYPSNLDDKKLLTYLIAVHKGAELDSRCFNIPKEEVTNCVYWRQLDATRNSIQMVGHSNFNNKELHKKSCNDIQDMLMTQKGINWNDFPTYQKRGSCCIKIATGEPDGAEFRARSKWVIDKEIPIFKGEGREYIDKLVYVGE